MVRPSENSFSENFLHFWVSSFEFFFRIQVWFTKQIVKDNINMALINTNKKRKISVTTECLSSRDFSCLCTHTHTRTSRWQQRSLFSRRGWRGRECSCRGPWSFGTRCKKTPGRGVQELRRGRSHGEDVLLHCGRPAAGVLVTFCQWLF